MVDKLPALHLYVQDYLADTRQLSNEIKGFYMDLLCYMHKSSRRGFLLQPNGNPYSFEQLGKMTGCSSDEASRLLRDLLSSEVISATPKGVPYSRRMVRDEKKRVLCKRAGHLGGNPTLKGGVNPPPYPSPEDENKDLQSSDLGGDARGGPRLRVRGVLGILDPGNMMPAQPDPPNIAATLATVQKANRPSAKDEFWEPICRIFKIKPVTQTDDNRLWQQCQEFRARGATVSEIEMRTQNYRLIYPNVVCTPKAVLNNWDVIAEPPAPQVSKFQGPIIHQKKSKAMS